MQSRHKPIILILILSYINVLNGQQQTSIYLPDKFIQEEIPIGSLIADVSEELEIEANRVAAKSATSSVSSSSTNSGENQHYTFLEDSKSSTENTYFLLDSITGRLTSKRYLDREAMCLNRHCARPCSESPGGSCSMRLRMLIIPSYQIVSLNVVVQDINDNKPQFRVDLVNLTVPENVPIGYRIPLDLAYDPDMGKNSIQSYSLTQQSNGNNNKKAVPTTESATSYFELIQPTTSENVQQQLQLVVKRALDRETVAQHNVSIVACDGGEPSNCGQLRLVVNIGDINDNSPIFRRELYEFSVFENAPKGTVVGRIEAYDLDAGINQKIKYNLMSSSTGGISYFELDELNGLLTLAQPIDFEIDKHFTLKAEARDFGVGSLPAYTQIEVRVLDLNDNPPEISVSFLNSLQRNTSSSSSSSSSTKSTNDLLIYLPENTESSSFIAHVSISDRDSPQHALISWSVLVNGVDISNSPYLTLNKLNDNSFTLLTGSQLDRERTPSISVNIVASNPTSSSNQSIVATYFNFTLILVDENDNSPQFDRDLYELNIPENNYLGQIIHKFTATDADVDENGRIVYSLESDGIAPKIVNIDAETGVLRALELFDREKTSLYEFIVVARDRPNELSTNSSKTSRARVRLNIIDQNDNKPVLVYNGTKETLNTSYILIKLDENIPVDTEIGRFECHDEDESSNGRTRMVLMSSYDVTLSRATGIQTLKSNNDGPFVIDDFGRFLVNKRLDRESQESFEYVLMCHDPTHNTSVNIHVRLNDVNDNCPRSLNRTNIGVAVKTVFLNRDSDVLDSVPIFTEYYTDDDSGHNAKLSFSLESHAVEFEANASESTDHVYGLKLSLRPNERERLQLGRYVVKLKISDHGNPSCIKTDTFLVYVGDNTTRTQTELIERLRAGITGYINDEYIDITDESADNKDVVTSLSKSETHKTNSLISHSRLSSALSSLRNTDYFILITLLSTLIITGSILSLVGLIFFCRRDGDKKKKKQKQISRGLEVKNYHRGELSVLNEDTESNNLLSSGGASDEVTTTTNRLSLSLKSTDQSQSADSVASNITFTRDTSSSNSSQADEHHLHHHHNQADLIMHKQYGPRVTFGNARNDYQYKNISTTMNRKSADLGQQTPSSYMSSFAPPSSSSSGSTSQQRALKSGANTATTNGIVYSHNTFTSNSLKHHHRPAPSHHHNHHHHQHLSSQSTYSTSLMMTPTSTSDGSSDTTNCDIIILPTSSSSSHSSSSSSSTSPQPPPPQTTVANSSLNRQQYNHYRHYVEINDDIDQVDDDDGDVDSSCLVVKQYDQPPVSNNNRTNASRYSNSYLRSSAV